MRIITTLAAFGLLVAVAGCNTVKGAGEDIESGGSAISDTATDTQQKM